MRIRLTLIALLLMVEAFGQQLAKPHPAGLLHGNHPPAIGDVTGAIHGVVISPGGKPAKGITVYALWLCPDSCPAVMTSTTTNEAGEYLFEPVTLGMYAVSLHYPLVDSPRSTFTEVPFTVTPLTRTRVELSANHSEAEVRFEINERLSPKKGK